MGYGEIRKAMRKLEDQQREDYGRCIQLMGTVTNTIELNRHTRQRNIAKLSERITKLETGPDAWQTEASHKKIWDRIQELENRHGDIWSAICKLRQKIHNTREAVRAVDDEAKSHYTRTLGTIDRLERRVAILEEGNRDPDARPLPEETQIQILGDFILEEIPGGIVPGEIVCDAAIRALKMYRAALRHIGWGGDRDESDFYRMTRMKRTAQDALDGGDND